jgi:hypothetical protein
MPPPTLRFLGAIPYYSPVRLNFTARTRVNPSAPCRVFCTFSQYFFFVATERALMRRSVGNRTNSQSDPLATASRANFDAALRALACAGPRVGARHHQTGSRGRTGTRTAVPAWLRPRAMALGS